MKETPISSAAKTESGSAAAASQTFGFSWGNPAEKPAEGKSDLSFTFPSGMFKLPSLAAVWCVCVCFNWLSRLMGVSYRQTQFYIQ